MRAVFLRVRLTFVGGDAPVLSWDTVAATLLLPARWEGTGDCEESSSASELE